MSDDWYTWNDSDDDFPPELRPRTTSLLHAQLQEKREMSVYDEAEPCETCLGTGLNEKSGKCRDCNGAGLISAW